MNLLKEHKLLKISSANQHAKDKDEIAKLKHDYSLVESCLTRVKENNTMLEKKI